MDVNYKIVIYSLYGCKNLTLIYSMKMMNIKKLASKLGLSITTVSRALGGYSDVSEKTRERVKKFAEKYQ